MTSTWLWSYRSANGSFGGSVAGCDPRDAVARVLTSTTSAGRLFGEEHGIPLDVLDEAPGNGDSQYTANGQGFSLAVTKARRSDGLPTEIPTGAT